MATIKGQNLRVLYNGDTIASALSCTLSVQLNVVKLSSKDDEDAYDINLPISLSWSVKASAVVTDVIDRPNAPSMLDMVGQSVMISLSRTNGSSNNTEDITLYAGMATISDINISAQNRQRSTYEVTFTGKRDMLQDIRLLVTADNHALETANGHTLAAAHEGL